MTNQDPQNQDVQEERRPIGPEEASELQDNVHVLLKDQHGNVKVDKHVHEL